MISFLFLSILAPLVLSLVPFDLVAMIFSFLIGLLICLSSTLDFSIFYSHGELPVNFSPWFEILVSTLGLWCWNRSISHFVSSYWLYCVLFSLYKVISLVSISGQSISVIQTSYGLIISLHVSTQFLDYCFKVNGKQYLKFTTKHW